MSILKHITFEGTQSVLSIGHRAVLYMLSARGPTCMHLGENVIGKVARKGIQELAKWGTVKLTPIVGRDEYYQLELTDLGKTVADEVGKRVRGQTG